jgi:ParB family chromosome partitioning protein
LKEIISEKAKENQTLSQGRGIKGLENSTNLIEPVDTRLELAKIAGVSDNTIARIEKINADGTPEQIERLRSSESSINEVYKEIQKPHITYGTGDNEWYTDEKIIESARKVLGNIDLDPASCQLANTIIKAEEIFTIETDGLKQEWHGNIWLNPPYSVSENPKFIDKLVSEYNSGHTKTALILVNNATETKWFERLISIASAICFPVGRLKFWSQQDKGSTPLQGQAIVYIGSNIDLFIQEFNRQGWCAITKSGKHI